MKRSEVKVGIRRRLESTKDRDVAQLFERLGMICWHRNGSGKDHGIKDTNITKESGINEELEQIQLSAGSENERDWRMRGKRIETICDKR
jgi:hypothetical protein